MKQPISSAHRKYVRFFDALRRKNCNFVFLTQKTNQKTNEQPPTPSKAHSHRPTVRDGAFAIVTHAEAPRLSTNTPISKKVMSLHEKKPKPIHGKIFTLLPTICKRIRDAALSIIIHSFTFAT